MGFPCGSAGKESTTMRETWVRSLDWEDALEKGKAAHSSILAWRIQSMGSQRVGHDWATALSLLLTKPSYFQRMSQNVIGLVKLFLMSREKNGVWYLIFNKLLILLETF